MIWLLLAYMLASLWEYMRSWVPQEEEKQEFLIKALALRAIAEQLPQESEEKQAALDDAIGDEATARGYHLLVYLSNGLLWLGPNPSCH